VCVVSAKTEGAGNRPHYLMSPTIVRYNYAALTVSVDSDFALDYSYDNISPVLPVRHIVST